jgi:hypothetical protein
VVRASKGDGTRQLFLEVGLPVDHEALVGVLSTQLLHRQLVAAPPSTALPPLRTVIELS